jgi:hypothetical protein
MFAGDGYPEYRRRNQFVVIRNGIRIDDRWVVPYNPYLLETFDCHINVEISAHKRYLMPHPLLLFELIACRCFKYVYKYCFKKPDIATVSIDEIETYITGRLLSASEAVWRLLGLKMHKEYPAVLRLDVHLPEHQQVIFDPSSDPRDIFEAAERSSSTLLEWFALNIRDVSARRLLYAEVPEFYVWKDNTWMPRSKGGIAVGRMYNVSIHNFELFALRTLLSCQRGCTSWSDVLLVDGFIHGSFRDACSAFGYLNDDSEFIAAFEEYLQTTIVSVVEMRHQFATMLSTIKVINAKSLFEHFATDLCGLETRDVALTCIERTMRSNGKSLMDDDFQFENIPYDNQCDEIIVNMNVTPLSIEQLAAVDDIFSMLESSLANRLMSVVAAAGTGKTFFVHHAASRLRDRGYSAMCVAASGLAANLLPQGKTAHAAFKIPINCDDLSFCSWSNDLRNRLYNVDVVFWDEISMVSSYVAGTVDRSFRQLMGVDTPFGGKVMVFLGDFRQLPPVIRGGKGEKLSLMSCAWFQNARKSIFTKNYRSRNPQYSIALELIGSGQMESVDIPPDRIAKSLDDAIIRLYGRDVTDSSNDKAMMLAFTLDQCAIVNAAVLQTIPGEAFYSDAFDDLRQCRSPDEYPPEYISSINVHGAPPARLEFKPGAKYVIIRNIDKHICNGVLAVGLIFTRFLCTMRLLSGPGAGLIVKIPRCTFHVTSENSGLPFDFCRRQFPLTPAYCVTVHRSQGQTLDNIGIIADTDPFAHGMLYVALSRVGSWNSVIFYSPREESFIKNKVCKQLVVNL